MLRCSCCPCRAAAPATDAAVAAAATLDGAAQLPTAAVQRSVAGPSPKAYLQG